METFHLVLIEFSFLTLLLLMQSVLNGNCFSTWPNPVLDTDSYFALLDAEKAYSALKSVGLDYMSNSA